MTQCQEFDIGGYSHKIGLFADDVVLALTNPAASLGKVQGILNDFRLVYYYKRHSNKSSILPICLSKQLKAQLKAKLKVKAKVANNLAYLGVNLTSPSESTYRANFPRLIGTIKQDLQHISMFELSWVGRVAALKMIVLPKIIYHFRTIRIVIPDCLFIEVDTFLGNLYGGRK